MVSVRLQAQDGTEFCVSRALIRRYSRLCAAMLMDEDEDIDDDESSAPAVVLLPLPGVRAATLQLVLRYVESAEADRLQREQELCQANDDEGDDDLARGINEEAEPFDAPADHNTRLAPLLAHFMHSSAGDAAVPRRRRSSGSSSSGSTAVGPVLVELLLAANYLHVPRLLRDVSACLAVRTNGMTVEQARAWMMAPSAPGAVDAPALSPEERARLAELGEELRRMRVKRW